MKRHLLGLLILTGLSLGASAQTCSPFPCVVTTATLTGQGAPLPPTAIFTPPDSGVFRISTYLSATHPINTAGTWTLYLAWTDDIGGRSAPTVAQTTSSNANTATFVVQAIGGKPVFYRTTAAGGWKGTTYNVYIVVEQLE